MLAEDLLVEFVVADGANEKWIHLVPRSLAPSATTGTRCMVLPCLHLLEFP